MPSTLKLSAHGLAERTGREHADATYGPLLEAQVAELGHIINATLAKIDEVQLDGRRGRLTGRGVGETIAELRQAAAGKIVQLTAARRRKLDDDTARAEKALSILEPPDDSDLKRERRERRYAEIRSYLTGIGDKLTRQATLEGAIMTDPIPDVRDMLLALSTAPALVRRELVGEGQLAELKSKFLARANPEAAASRSAARTTAGLLGANEQAALRSIGASAGLATRLKHDVKAAASA